MIRGIAPKPSVADLNQPPLIARAASNIKSSRTFSWAQIKSVSHISQVILTEPPIFNQSLQEWFVFVDLRHLPWSVKMYSEEDGMPLVDVKSRDQLCRTTSCFGEPSVIIILKIQPDKQVSMLPIPNSNNIHCWQHTIT